MNDALRQLSLLRQIELLRDGEIAPGALVRAYGERLEAANGSLHAVVTSCVDQALVSTRLPASAASLDLTPLAGVPFLAKDLYDTAGVRTTYGSVHYATHVPRRDAFVVGALKRAGGLLLGKTNTAAFGFGFVTTNQLFGETLNPWDPWRTAGGSSGGCAAAVAAGMAPFAIGSDLAGSVRLPAHCCGVVGFRPTPGVISIQGHSAVGTALMAELLAPGIFARHVEDVALVYSVLCGYTFKDPLAHPLAQHDRRLRTREPGQLRIASLGFGGAPPGPAVAAALATAGHALTAEGGTLTARPLPLARELAPTMATFLAAGFDTAGALAGEATFAAELAPVGLADLMRACEARLALRTVARTLFERADLALAPVLNGGAPPVETPPKVAELGPSYLAVLAGLPVLTVPVGMTADGHPVAIQILGAPGDDLLVLRAGMYLQQMTLLNYRRLEATGAA